jgi:hypothetical protein
MVATTAAGLAGAVGTLPHSHIRQLAPKHGQAGWHTRASLLSVDGIEFVALLSSSPTAEPSSGQVGCTGRH